MRKRNPTTQRYSLLSSTGLKRCRGSWDHVLIQGHHGITSVFFFDLSLVGTGFRSIKKWFKAQISGILLDVFSYISNGVCYNIIVYKEKIKGHYHIFNSFHGRGIDFFGTKHYYRCCSQETHLSNCRRTCSQSLMPYRMQ